MVALMLQLVAYTRVEGNNVNRGCGMVNWAATYVMDSEGREARITAVTTP